MRMYSNDWIISIGQLRYECRETVRYAVPWYFYHAFLARGPSELLNWKKKFKLDSIQCSQRQWNQLPRFVSTTVIAVCGIESLAVLGRVQNERLIFPVLVDFILYSETEAKQKGQIGSAFNLFPILLINFSLFFFFSFVPNWFCELVRNVQLLFPNWKFPSASENDWKPFPFIFLKLEHKQFNTSVQNSPMVKMVDHKTPS